MKQIKLALVIGLMVSGSVYATAFNNGGWCFGFSDYTSSQNIYRGLSFIFQKGGISRLFYFSVSIKYSLVTLKTNTDNFRCWAHRMALESL